VNAHVQCADPGVLARDRGSARARHVRRQHGEGTADVVVAPTVEVIKRIHIVSDRDERMREIMTSPPKLAFYLAIRQAIGEGHVQLVDDMFSTRDGRLLAVPRPEASPTSSGSTWLRRHREAPGDARISHRPHEFLARRPPPRCQ
jgi:hypothetical protein